MKFSHDLHSKDIIYQGTNIGELLVEVLSTCNFNSFKTDNQQFLES